MNQDKQELEKPELKELIKSGHIMVRMANNEKAAWNECFRKWEAYHQQELAKSKVREVDIEKVRKAIIKAFPRINNFLDKDLNHVPKKIAQAISAGDVYKDKGREVDVKKIAFSIKDADLQCMKVITKERRNEACFDIAQVIANGDIYKD